MKKYSPESQVKEYANKINSEFDHWKRLYTYGCSDPFGTDGENLELTRNHIIYDQRAIKDLCDKFELPLPPEAVAALPDEVSNDYMARAKESGRIQ